MKRCRKKNHSSFESHNYVGFKPITLPSSLPETSIVGSVLEKSTLQALFSCSSYSMMLCSCQTIQLCKNWKESLITPTHQKSTRATITHQQDIPLTFGIRIRKTNLMSVDIPNSNNTLVVTAGDMGLNVFVPTKTT
jgi:hypothetical protein